MKFILLFIFNLLMALFMPKNEVPKSIYDFKVEAVAGGSIDFSQFRGKKILIVNHYCPTKILELQYIF